MRQIWSKVVNGAKLVIVESGEGFTGRIFPQDDDPLDFSNHEIEPLKAALLNKAGELHPNYHGFDGAKARFLDFFSDGFDDPAYLRWERDYKRKVMAFLADELPLETAIEASRNEATLARRAFGTNMLSSYENARVHQLLGSDNGPAFLRAAARFTLQEDGGQADLDAMVTAIAPFGRHSWPILTYLPNFWRPGTHMFLKPDATIDYAERTGSSFAVSYSPQVKIGVYRELLAMARETRRKLSALKPKDDIDVQSFIWVVGSYAEAEKAEIEAWKSKRAD